MDGIRQAGSKEQEEQRLGSQTAYDPPALNSEDVSLGWWKFALESMEK